MVVLIVDMKEITVHILEEVLDSIHIMNIHASQIINLTMEGTIEGE